MKSLTAAIAATIFALSGATAVASTDHQTFNDVSVVSIDRAAGAVQVSSYGVIKTLDADQLQGVYVPLNVSEGDTLRLSYDGSELDSIRPIN